MEYQTIDPATGRLIETFPILDAAGVERALERADRAFRSWREREPRERAALLLRVAETLEGRTPELADLMALEMGKPVAQGQAEARKCAWACRYFADHAEELLRDDPRESDGSEAFVRAEPLGPVLAIMPWNFPFWQLFRFAVPALAAGNVVLLKHAPNTPRCGLTIEQLLLESGFPEGVLQNVFLTNDQAASVIGDGRVRGVTLTGSTRAGREVGAVAARQLKKMVLELGGSDPFVVLEDADLKRAVEVGVQSRCLNSGQSCIAAKRFLAHESIFEEFRDRFVSAMSAQVVGHPALPEVDIGPLARRDLRDQLAGQVEASRVRGARVLCGGRPLDGEGFYYPPTVLVDVPPGTPAAEEELFGPVATLGSFRTEEQALSLANGTRFGLGASLWTRDRERARRLIPRFDAGSVFVNGLVKSDPRLPFGGVKDSGFGRELAREGLLEFTNLKTVWQAP